MVEPFGSWPPTRTRSSVQARSRCWLLDVDPDAFPTLRKPGWGLDLRRSSHVAIEGDGGHLKMQFEDEVPHKFRAQQGVGIFRKRVSLAVDRLPDTGLAAWSQPEVLLAATRVSCRSLVRFGIGQGAAGAAAGAAYFQIRQRLDMPLWTEKKVSNLCAKPAKLQTPCWGLLDANEKGKYGNNKARKVWKVHLLLFAVLSTALLSMRIS